MRPKYQNLLEAIGDTPLVKVPFDGAGEVHAKLEYLNPGGSIKDRSALFMIEDAEKTGTLKPGGTIVEASSGNQGIAIAMIGAVKGYKVIITVSEKVSEEKMKTLRAYGAEVVVCPSTDFIEDPKSYHSQADEILKKTPGAFMPNQYFNPKNPEAHYRTLGPEIWKQTEGKVTHVFAAAGTGGHVSGVGKYLKEQNPKVKICAVDVDTSFHATGGHPKPYKMEGIGIDFEAPCLDESVIDEFIPVSDEEGLGMLKIMASKYGLLLGTSSGAVAYAGREYAKKLSWDDLAVMIFGDSGRAYLSKNYY
jgi:cystathionine beta-synthase